MSDKFQVGIYKIGDDYNLNILCDAIQNSGFISQSLTNSSQGGYNLSLYYQEKPSNPRWKGFLEDIVSSGQTVILRNRGRGEGFILILDKCENIYVVTGGHGFFAIQYYIDNEFGIDIFSRLINKEDKVLKATREKSVVGGILGTSKHFRSNFNLYETDDFGKIYQELKASLNKAILTDKFGFTEEDIKTQSFCVAKASFTINKAISFDQLLNIIDGCESVIETETPIAINNVEKIIKKRNTELIKRLESNLLSQLWQRYNQGIESYDFDLCHNDFEKYLTASKYCVKKGNSKIDYFESHEFESFTNIDILFNQLRLSQQLNEEDFNSLIKVLKIISYDGEGNELTKGQLISHIMGDVTENDKKYFYINNSWYFIKPGFIVDLNSSCQSYINNNKNTRLNKLWGTDVSDEDAYNKQYIGEPGTIVLHKITPDNIEACDILIWDEQNVYLYHVKKGFNNTLRDLCSQISVAAKRILLDISSDKSYITKLYDSLTNYQVSSNEYFRAIGRQTLSYSLETFKGLFDKKLIFVLAVVDTSQIGRYISNIQSFNSNIAKFSLQSLSREIRGLGLDLEIAQIWKEVPR